MIPDHPEGSSESGRSADSAAEVAERSRAWTRAIQDRDVERAAGFLDEAFALVLVQPVRSVMPREQWLELLPDYVMRQWNVLDQVVDIQGDVAAALQRVHMDATVLGQDRSGTFVVTDIWRRNGGEWRIWRRHSTPMVAGEIPTLERHDAG